MRPVYEPLVIVPRGLPRSVAYDDRFEGSGQAMSDQVIGRDMARAIQADASPTHAQFAWVVQHDAPEHPGIRSAVYDRPSDHLIVADMLAEIQAMLPSGLDRSARQPVDPLDVVEIRFASGP